MAGAMLGSCGVSGLTAVVLNPAGHSITGGLAGHPTIVGGVVSVKVKEP